MGKVWSKNSIFGSKISENVMECRYWHFECQKNHFFSISFWMLFCTFSEKSTPGTSGGTNFFFSFYVEFDSLQHIKKLKKSEGELTLKWWKNPKKSTKFIVFPVKKNFFLIFLKFLWQIYPVQVFWYEKEWVEKSVIFAKNKPSYAPTQIQILFEGITYTSK